MIVPVRDEGLVFAAAEKLTVPFPFPLLAVVIHVALLCAVQEHPALTTTPKLPEPPVAAIFVLVGDNENAQASSFRIVPVPVPT